MPVPPKTAIVASRENFFLNPATFEMVLQLECLPSLRPDIPTTKKHRSRSIVLYNILYFKSSNSILLAKKAESSARLFNGRGVRCSVIWSSSVRIKRILWELNQNWNFEFWNLELTAHDDCYVY